MDKNSANIIIIQVFTVIFLLNNFKITFRIYYDYVDETERIGSAVE
jgi:hypothetical protein